MNYSIHSLLLKSVFYSYAIFIAVYYLFAYYFYMLPNDFYWVGINFRDEYFEALFVEILFGFYYIFIFYFLSYFRCRSVSVSFIDDVFEKRKGIVFSVGLAMILFYPVSILLTGGSFSFSSLLGGSLVIQTNSIVSYAQSFFTCSVVFVLYLFYKRRNAYFVILSLFYLYICLSVGFRFRVALFFLMILFCIYLRDRGFPGRIKIIAIALFSVFVIGVVGATRQYTQGLDLSRLYNTSLVQTLSEGVFNDSNIIFTSGMLIEHRFQFGGYKVGEGLVYALFHPIPRSIWAEKPVYESGATELFGSASASDYGAALTLAGESFNNFGLYFMWIIPLIFAYILTRFIRYIVSFRNMPLLIVTFSSIFAWSCYSFTRGYFPQIIQDLLFLLLALVLLGKITSTGGYKLVLRRRAVV